MDIQTRLPATRARKPTTEDYILYGRHLRAEYFASLFSRGRKSAAMLLKHITLPVRHRRPVHG
ncbi:MAG: hypothetical protein R3298_12350 [Gammaproteobacteria bacterium]|nr:hypothetical protein [Gammaproteobacteria bacterium]